jgi:PAS domain S-box-containing protein
MKNKSPQNNNEYDLLLRALDSFEDGFIIIKDSKIDYCNKSLSNLIGYTQEEIVGKPKDYYISEHYKLLINRYYDLRINGQKEVPKSYRVEIKHRNGENIPVQLNISSFYADDNFFVIAIIKDLREEIAKEEELNRKQIQYAEIFDNTAISICLCDLDGKIILSNKSFNQVFGFLNHSAEGIDLKNILKDNNVNRFFDEAVRNPNKIPKTEFSIKLDSFGKTKWVKIFVNKIGYKNYVFGLLFSFTDISKQVELQLKNEFEGLLLQNLMNSFPESIYFKDEFSRFIRVNKATLEKFNLKDFEEIIGKTDFELFENEHASAARDDEIKLLKGEVEFVREVEKETYRDKKIKWVLTTKIPLKDNENKIFGTVGISRDITEIRKNQLILEALFKISSAVTRVENLQQFFKEIHEIIKTLMKADNFFIALIDDKTKVVSFPYFVDQFDPQPQPRKMKKGLTEYIYRLKEPMLIDRKKDLELRLKGETELIGEPSAIWLGVPLKIGDEVIGVLVIQDYEDETTYGVEEKEILTYVSEQIALAIKKLSDEQKLKEYSNELKELVATKDKLFSIISHDLKSPIQGLMGLSELLAEDIEILTPEEIKEDLIEIKNSAISLYKLIENLLDWSRFQTGRMQLKPITLNAFILVDKVVKNLINSAKLKSITINNNINPNNFIIGDENLISSLFHNLISNAIKFTNFNGEININSFDENNKVIFEVVDNGIGIAPENLEKIFRFDCSITTAGTNNERGTGLGLVLCKEIINAHKGTIKISSEVGKGTRISFDLLKPI